MQIPMVVSHLEAVGSLLAPPVAEAAAWFALLAQGGGKSYGLSWAIVLLCVILGLLVALKSSRRTTEVKRHREY